MRIARAAKERYIRSTLHPTRQVSGNTMSFRFVASALLSIVVVAFSMKLTNVMEGELRLYKEPDFGFSSRFRRGIFAMTCRATASKTSSLRLDGRGFHHGATFADGHVKIAFYAGKNCTGKVTVLNTNVGEVPNFAQSEMDNATTSIAVLETSNTMQHPTKNLCNW
ncbi:hypothetical protein GQ600_23046 [Phytophthora cactorum]|nr:hypothetical protein GQ600_23046 [Phytophthora cactorum]